MQKKLLITGASRGIGFETASILAEQGHHIVAVARSADKLDQLVSLHPGSITAISADLAMDDGILKIKNTINQENIRLDGLLNNAGVLINKPFTQQNREDWLAQANVNMIAPALLIRELVPFFNKNAHIVNIGSMGGFQGSSKFPGLSAYSATKGALAILTECIAAELANESVSCNCLCLGAVQTEMLNSAFPGIEVPMQPEQMGAYIAEFLLNAHTFYNGKLLPVSLADPA
ncbi:MAG: SDR family NAD(P)-dependent oxidoreductase [Balneolaceae bacterium]